MNPDIFRCYGKIELRTDRAEEYIDGKYNVEVFDDERSV
jgi:hypothetical protein